MDLSFVSAIHTYPNPMPIPSSGFDPTRMVAITALVLGSIRSTSLLLVFDTHSEPKPVSSQAGPTGTLIRAVIGNADIGGRSTCGAGSAARAEMLPHVHATMIEPYIQ